MAVNRLMSFASIGILTACLIITGIASLLWLDVTAVVDYLSAQNEISVFIDKKATDQEIDELKAQIGALPNVESVEFYSKDDTYAQVKDWMEDYGDLMKGYENLLPAKFIVTVEDLNFISETNNQLAELPKVEKTRTSTDLAGALIMLKKAVSYGGLGLVGVLALVAVIVISNTIRLTVFARRREISIMKYVGATNTFIRLPFFVEGMTVGLIAGMIASLVVCGGYYFVYEYLRESYNTWVLGLISTLLKPADIWYKVVLCFAAFGIVIGGFGTASSVRKHLKV